MLTKVRITGLGFLTVARIDRALGGASWRFDIHEHDELYDVDVSNNCEVLYCTNAKCVNALVLSSGDLAIGLKTEEYNQIIAC